MKKRTLCTLFALSLLMLNIGHIHAQVTVGTGLPPTRAALLDLKEKQNANPANVGDTESVTKGGLLLPRVKLVSTATLEPFIPTTDGDWDGGTKEKKLKLSLVGLMVYNVASVGTSLYPGLYTWDGTQWATSQANPSAGMEISVQPKKFSFYETGNETVENLSFTVSGAVGVTYEWYQVTGNNVHIRVGTPIGGSGTVAGTGAKTSNFTPTGVIKGTTRNANNAGFYKFYCEATDSYGKKLQSDIAEVAVGCGAKNNEGNWLTFMCFNLGAGENHGTAAFEGMSIADQINYPIGTFTNAPNGNHDYIPGEEKLWGDMYQWGRVADGHEKRQSDMQKIEDLSSTDFGHGNMCSASDIRRPLGQVKEESIAHGKFITTMGNTDRNWAIVDQTNINLLWRAGRFVQNDPCAHFNEDGSMQEFWHKGTNNTSAGIAACSTPNSGWKTPAIEEFGAIYKGGTLSGPLAQTTANSWVYNKTNGRGHEVRPDGITTTLFFPFAGQRTHATTATLAYAGQRAYYWSTTSMGTSAYDFALYATTVTVNHVLTRGYGGPIRCTKYE